MFSSISFARCLLALSVLNAINAFPLANRQATNTAQLAAPTTVMTVTNSMTPIGPLTQTCVITLTPVKDANGQDAVQEVKNCTVAMNASSSSTGSSSSSSNGTSSSSSSSSASSNTSSTSSSSDSGSGSSTASSTSSSSDSSSSGSSTASSTSSSSDSGSSGSSTASSTSTTSSADSGSTGSSTTSSALTASVTLVNSAVSVNGGVSTMAPLTPGTQSASGASAASTTAASSADSSTATASAGASSSASGSGISTATAAADNSNPSASSLASQQLATQEYVVPGKSIQVLPIGLGVFAGISALALIVVGLVTYERTKYRKAFRQRKLAEQGAAMGYSR